MYIAYALRGGNRKGIEMRHMGAFLGQLLIRGFDRAERIYRAMKCRGYASATARGGKRALTAGDIICVAAVFPPCLLLRLMSASALFGVFFGR
jgi:cobalt/nickel transport system permease protein